MNSSVQIQPPQPILSAIKTTYSSAFWELYLFAVLRQLGVQINFAFDAPDFVSANHPIAIEAAIASYA